MKYLFTLLALGSVSVVSAGHYNTPYGNGPSDCPSCYYNNGRYYQDQPNQGYYYQPNRYQNQRGYYQREDGNSPRNDQYEYQPQMQRYQDNNRQFYQQRDNPSYRDQERSYDNTREYRDQKRYYDNNPLSENDVNQKPVSDMEIRKKIEDKMTSGWFSKGFQNVTFDVNHGNVDLKGSVDTLESKNKVEESVKKIEGVRQVNNHITIVKENPDSYSESELKDSEKNHPQDVASNVEDRQINAKIRDKISSWFSNDTEVLMIKTTNGIVIISGPVDNIEDAQKLIDRIKEIEGVKSVKNQLVVRRR